MEAPAFRPLQAGELSPPSSSSFGIAGGYFCNSEEMFLAPDDDHRIRDGNQGLSRGAVLRSHPSVHSSVNFFDHILWSHPANFNHIVTISINDTNWRRGGASVGNRAKISQTFRPASEDCLARFSRDAEICPLSPRRRGCQ
jgi:hypothetical protein